MTEDTVPRSARHRLGEPLRGGEFNPDLWHIPCSCGWEHAGSGSTLEEAALHAKAHAATGGRTDAIFGWLADERNLSDDDLQLLMRSLHAPLEELNERVHAREWLTARVQLRLYKEIVRRETMRCHVEADLAGGHVRLLTLDDTDDGGGYVSACLCDWTSAVAPTETDADALLDEHLAAFWASVPEGMTVRGSWCRQTCGDDATLDVTCRGCEMVRYVGPDCDHVPQPLPVSPDGLCWDCGSGDTS